MSWVRVIAAAEALYAVRGLGRLSQREQDALAACVYEVQTVLMAVGVDWMPPEVPRVADETAV